MTWWMVKRAVKISALSFRLTVTVILWVVGVWLKTRRHS
jgi:hypothetical protein